MRSTMLFAVALLALLPGSARADEAEWYADYDQAAKVAQETGKDLLVDFTGSEWCGWCKRLHAEVFAHAEFLEAAKKQYVLLALDFPRDPAVKAKVPNPARNEELKNKYGVTGFPTILLMDADGNPYARTGYKPGGATAYVTHLEELRTTGRPNLAKVLAAAAAVESATGDDRQTALAAALDLMNELKESPVILALVPAAKEALNGDLRDRAIQVLMETGKADAEVLAAAIEADPKNEQGLYEKAVAAQMGTISSREQLQPMVDRIEALLALGPIQDKNLEIQFRASAAFWSHQFLNRPEKAKEHALALKELAPDNPRAMNLVRRILGE
jgi:thioredoxin-related protein